jgi:spore coat protein U-like protein
MKTKTCRLLALAALVLLSTAAKATISCNVSSNGFNTAYDPALATMTTVQTSASVSCTRSDPTNDPSSIAYSIKADNGLYAAGINNRARLSGSSEIKYDVFQNSTCATQWKGNTTFSGTINFNVSPSNSHSYWGCVIALQPGLAAGTYTDMITMTLTYGANPPSTATGTFFANIAAPWACSLSSAPGTVAFGTYVAYGAAVTASTSFGVTCTNYMPYTVAVSPTGGTIAGVNYTLAPSVSSNNGSGIQQVLSINGTMAAGQSGNCAIGSCSGTNAHTLTVTY